MERLLGVRTGAEEAGRGLIIFSRKDNSGAISLENLREVLGNEFEGVTVEETAALVFVHVVHVCTRNF